MIYFLIKYVRVLIYINQSPMIKQVEKKTQKYISKFNTKYFEDRKTPITVSHRGHSSLFFENSWEGIQAGLFRSDLVEIDILLTKDHQLAIYHDRFLSAFTNASTSKQVEHLKCEKDLQNTGTIMNDWWLQDFTRQQLQGLNIIRGNKNRPQHNNITFKIPFFEQIIIDTLELKKNQPNLKSGLLIEVKGREEFNQNYQVDKIICEKVFQILQKYDLTTQEKCLEKNCPIILESFTYQNLKTFNEMGVKLPMVYCLFEHMDISNQFLTQRLFERIIGIAVPQLICNKTLKENCQKHDLALFYWTVIDDYLEKIPFGCSNYEQVYRELLKIGVDGFITEFPEKCNQILKINELEKKWQQKLSLNR